MPLLTQMYRCSKDARIAVRAYWSFLPFTYNTLAHNFCDCWVLLIDVSPSSSKYASSVTQSVGGFTRHGHVRFLSKLLVSISLVVVAAYTVSGTRCAVDIGAADHASLLPPKTTATAVFRYELVYLIRLCAQAAEAIGCIFLPFSIQGVSKHKCSLSVS